MRSEKQLTIDLSGFRDERSLHQYLADSLGFFEGYGCNFDALWDCVTDEGLSAMPDHLTVEGLDALERHLPGACAKLTECLVEYAKALEGKRVTLLRGSSPSNPARMDNNSTT